MSKPKFISVILCILFLLSFLGIFTKQAKAFTSSKDVISTSRPSASTYLAIGSSSAATAITIGDNYSRFIASDSALLAGGTAEYVTVASMSGINTPSAGQRRVSLASASLQIHGVGTSVYVPITAKHIISFRNENAVPATGKIQVIFPVGDVTNPGLPSIAGFSMNNLTSSTGPSNNQVTVTGVICASYTVTLATGIFQCNLGTTGLTGPNNITINIGTTTPIMINPAKTAVGGTADVWTVQIKTLDDSGYDIETLKIKIGTVDSVQVYATVEPTFTFSIAGLTNGTAVNIGNTGNYTNGCANTEVSNTGFNSTSTEVNLGVLSSGQINISAQLLTVASNGISGYSITATSSGHLLDLGNGFWITDAQGDAARTVVDAPAPAGLTAGSSGFGIHPCGSQVPSSPVWGTGTTASGNAKYANPNAAYYYTVASKTSGPITGTQGDGMTTVEYGGSVSTAVPAGLYQAVMTYVATPIF